jgi:hypothetical protein
LLDGQTLDANYFIPARFAGRNGNGRSRNLQKFREEVDAGLVGASVDWKLALAVAYGLARGSW